MVSVIRRSKHYNTEKTWKVKKISSTRILQIPFIIN